MHKRPISIIIVILAILILGGFVWHKKDSKPAPAASTQPTEQINDTPTPEQISDDIQPDINNQEFKLTEAAITCSNTGCNGTIRIVPSGEEERTPGLYKISEQTRLVHNNEVQNPKLLEQLAQNQTAVRLTLVTGSDDTLAEIRY